MKKFTMILIIVLGFFFSGDKSSAGDLRDLIPNLYGGDGIFLDPVALPPHSPHFTTGTQDAITQLNQNIGSEISIFPFSASGGGFTFAFDTRTGTFVRSTETLGPLFAERAPTLGRGRFNLQFASTFFKYDEFEGNSLDNLRTTASHQPNVIGSPNEREDFELDAIRLTFDIDIRVQIFSFAVTYGITDRLDIGILVPLVRVDMDVDVVADIIRSDKNASMTDFHQEGEESLRDSASDDAFGIGDIVLRAKYQLLASDLVDIAAALLIKPATGDENDFLGTGDTTVRPFLVVSRTFFNRFTPHLNLGYEFQNDDESSLEYVAGFDLSILRSLSVVAGIIGSHALVNGDDIGDHIVNGSFGARWNPFAQLVLSGNVLVSLNDDGLRSDVIPTFAVEYSF